MKNSIRLAAIAATTSIVIAACGGSGGAQSSGETVEPSPGQTTDVSVGLSESAFGEILVDGAGLTLYGFSDDAEGESTCYDACATAWPPVPGDAQVSDGVDASLLRTIQREDGGTQLAIGDWPLYYFSGDAAPGDVNGQGSGDVWFVVNEVGSLVAGRPAEEVQASTGAADGVEDDPYAESGSSTLETPVLTDGDGLTLYVFTNDTAGVSTCNEPCSDTWPPVLADEAVAIDPLRLDVIARSDGSRQLAIDGSPLYRYLGDTAPGDVTGHEVGGVWFAVGADGQVIRPAGLRVGSTDIGDALIDADGFTLYTFENDVPGVSTCNQPCSNTWPPVSGETRIDTAVLDISQFTAITRDDGSLQLAIDGWPLYRYAGDTFPGDANGIAVGGGVWDGVPSDQIAQSDGSTGAVVSVAASGSTGAIAVGETDLGPTLVDAAGMTLYGLLDDSPDSSTCEGACADAWPPVPGDSQIPDGADPELFRVIERADGSTQLAVGDWPLYRFSGDGAPGDINGQGSGDVWFVANPDGWLYK